MNYQEFRMPVGGREVVIDCVAKNFETLEVEDI